MGIATNPAIQRISKLLADAFLEVGEKIRQELVTAYRQGAKSRHDRLIAVSADPRRVGRINDPMAQHKAFPQWHEHTTFDKKAAMEEWEAAHPRRTQADYALMPPDWIEYWEQVRKYAHLLKLTYKTADRNANAAYEDARDSFIIKNTQKIANVLGGRTDLVDAQVRFRWRSGVFEGGMKVELSDAEFAAELSLKYVVRHIPRTTPYFQYPLLFTGATVKGVVHRAPSEEELRVLLGAKKTVAEEKAEVAAAEGVCPMSGKQVPEALLKGKYSMIYVSARCPACGASVSVNKQSWNFRSHKTPAATKGAAATKLEAAGYCPSSREKVPTHIIAAMGPVDGYKDPKALCERCGQQVRLDSQRDWIRKAEGEYPTHMQVMSATYYKHKLPK